MSFWHLEHHKVMLKVDGISRMNSSHFNVYDGKECVVVSVYLHVVILIASNLSP